MPGPYPAIDQTICSSWNELAQNTYNTYPYYLAKLQIKLRRTYATHSKAFGKKPWVPNMGPVMRGVRKDPAPHVRQEFTPAEMSGVTKKDIIDVAEVTMESTLKLHNFESRLFNFFPSFNDFLTDHLSATSASLAAQIQRSEDLFCRVVAFHGAPFVWIANKAGGAVIQAPVYDCKDMANIAINGKNTNWRQAQIPTLGNPGNLSLDTIYQADSFLREDIRAVPWNGGSDAAPKDNMRQSGNNLLVLSNEAYNQLRVDPFMLANRALSLDVVTDGFKGLPGGNVICRVEDLPLRMAADGTFPNVQTRELGTGTLNQNETVNSSAYNNAPFEWAFLYANEPYQSIEIGPPPAEFVNSGIPKGFRGMWWNGEIRLIHPAIIPCTDENGVATFMGDDYGKYLKFVSAVSYGAIASQRRNCIPILFKRVRGLA